MFSDDRYEKFNNKLVDILNYGALNLALGIGYRLGLLEAMAALDKPATVESIAQKAELSARYVREWLGVMMSGDIVELTAGPEGELYFLPAEHAAVLTGAGGKSNMGVYTQEIPLLTDLAANAVESGFRTGEGVPYTRYPTFQAFMSELSIAKHKQLLVETFIPSVDDGKLLKRLEDGIKVLDLGCGEGTATILMAEAFPNSTFSGMDIAEEALAEGRRLAGEKDLENINFIQADAALLADDPDLAGAFDYITAFDAIHDQTAPLEALKSAYHLLARGGIFSMVDIAAESGHQGNKNHPMGPFLYTVSLMHCMPVGLCDGGAGLGMMWGRQKAVEMMKQAGFDQVQREEMDYDPFNYHFVGRKI